MYAIGYRSDRTRNYAAGLYYLVVSTVIAGVAVLLLGADSERSGPGGEAGAAGAIVLCDAGRTSGGH